MDIEVPRFVGRRVENPLHHARCAHVLEGDEPSERRVPFGVIEQREVASAQRCEKWERRRLDSSVHVLFEIVDRFVEFSFESFVLHSARAVEALHGEDVRE